MNRLKTLFLHKRSHVLNVYFTAGYPQLDATVSVIHHLRDAGADIIELGIPYSDPLADGTTIQGSSAIALKNGINLKQIFDQVSEVRTQKNEIPIIFMGYFNQILQFGEEKFLKECQLAGVDGLIVPDIPMQIYEKQYKKLFKQYNIGISFLITPDTSDQRILKADQLSTDFIYVVSQSSITGKTGEISQQQIEYFDRIKSLQLKSPTLIGFGIHDHKTFAMASQYSNGAIVGSAFIRQLASNGYSKESIQKFINTILQD